MDHVIGGLAFLFCAALEILLVIYFAWLIRSACTTHEIDITLVDSFISAGIIALISENCWEKAKTFPRRKKSDV